MSVFDQINALQRALHAAEAQVRVRDGQLKLAIEEMERRGRVEATYYLRGIIACKNLLEAIGPTTASLLDELEADARARCALARRGGNGH